MRHPLLAPLSGLYKAAVVIRHRLFDWGILPSERYAIPVVCIGNLTAGGTGKTPLCEMVVDYLGRNRPVAILSRGYGRRTKGYREVTASSHYRDVGDEPLMLKRRFPATVVVVCERRREGIRRLLHDHPEVGVVVMDDGFQHRYVEAKINLLTIDSTRPPWEDRMLPWGDLRDVGSQLHRVNYFIVTRCMPGMTPIERRIHRKHLVGFPYQSIYFTHTESGTPRPLFPDEAEEEVACGAKVVAMAGIGHPPPFFEELERRYAVVDRIAWEDHHVYRLGDLKRIAQALTQAGEDAVVITTEKDAVKLLNREKLPAPLRGRLYYLPISLSFIESSATDFLQKLEKDVGRD